MLQLLRRRELPWHRRVQARFRDVSGIVVIGDVHGDLLQLAGRACPLRLDWKPLRGTDPLAWLHWKTRLAPTLVGREREMESLRRWAEEGRGVRARVLSGEGGTGKTRLAAELAQELRDEGWQAGFADLRRSGDGAGVFKAGAHGTLILLDYPEEHREATRELLRDLAKLEGDEKLRVLLLSRRGDDLWQPEIDRADAYGIFDEVSLDLGPLPVQDLYRIFQEARGRVPVLEGTAAPASVDEDAFATWLQGETAHRRPLFVLAAAIESALEPARSVVRLQGREVIQALARRELTRLREESQDAGLHPETLARLVALAAIAGGLDTGTLRRLAESEDTLELGLPPPKRVTDRLQATGRLIRRDGDRRIPAPSPDLVAAAILVEILGREPELAPERLWAAVEGDVPAGLERVGRLAYDAEVTLGLLDQRPSEWLRLAFEQDPGRCSIAAKSFYQEELPLGLMAAAPTVWRRLLQGDLSEAQRGEVLNNLSIHLAALGLEQEALSANGEAVELWRVLSSSDPRKYEGALVGGLNNQANRLLRAALKQEALTVVEEAVSIARQMEPAHDLSSKHLVAKALINYSGCLLENGRREEALQAVEEAVELLRELSSEDSRRYEPDFAMAIYNLSVHLAKADRRGDSFSAAGEAVRMFERLASANPWVHESDYAMSLLNLSVRLSEAGRDEEALSVAERAAETYRRLSLSQPTRFVAEYACCLNSISDFQFKVGRSQGALATLRKALELIKVYTRQSPAGPHGELQVTISANLRRMEMLASRK